MGPSFCFWLSFLENENILRNIFWTKSLLFRIFLIPSDGYCCIDPTIMVVWLGFGSKCPFFRFYFRKFLLSRSAKIDPIGDEPTVSNLITNMEHILVHFVLYGPKLCHVFAAHFNAAGRQNLSTLHFHFELKCR